MSILWSDLKRQLRFWPFDKNFVHLSPFQLRRTSLVCKPTTLATWAKKQRPRGPRRRFANWRCCNWNPLKPKIRNDYTLRDKFKIYWQERYKQDQNARIKAEKDIESVSLALFTARSNYTNASRSSQIWPNVRRFREVVPKN